MEKFRPFVHRAFTLVEMLVVVAIVGLLAAIIFPVFGRVKNGVKTQSCQNNLHQIGLALAMYSNDHNERYPSDRLGSSPNCYWPDVLIPYTKSADVFSCPSLPEDAFTSSCATPYSSDAASHISYHGSYTLDTPGMMAVVSTMRIRTPTTLILVAEGPGVFSHTAGRVGSGRMTQEDLKSMGLKFPHNDSANALFADGHTKWLTLDEYGDRSHWSLSGNADGS